MTLLRAATEDELLTAATEALTLYRWRWTHARRSDRALTMGHPGLPDIIAVRDGRVLFCEVKSQVGRLSPDQVLWLDALKECDVDYFLLRPDTLDTFLAVIR